MRSVYLLKQKVSQEEELKAKENLAKLNLRIVEDSSDADFIVTKLTSVQRIRMSLPTIKYTQKVLKCEKAGRELPVGPHDLCISPTLVPSSPQSYQKPVTHESPKSSPFKRSRTLSESSDEGISMQGYACQRRTPLLCPNDDLIAELKKIEKARKLTGDERSLLSYEKAIAAIRAYPKKLHSGSEAFAIKDIGPKIAHMVQEFIASGVIEEARELEKNERLKVLEKFESIYGVGASTAARWYTAGYRAIEQLSESEVLSPTQILWLNYYDDLSQDMTRKDGMQLFGTIKKEILLLEPDAKVTCTGGFRRGKSFSRDLDILITHPVPGRYYGLLRRIVLALKEKNILQHELMMQTEKYNSNMHVGKSHAKTDSLDKCLSLCIQTEKGIMRQVDLIVSPIEAYATALFGWTGSKQFERSVRSYAKKVKGLHITNTGLYNVATRERIDVKSEEEIFSVLGLEYLVPEDRNC